jgi:hypothetical protein
MLKLFLEINRFSKWSMIWLGWYQQAMIIVQST